jgi:predicted MPP superfamily phosphohydrolase
MKRAVWLTDIHLNFLNPPAIRRFLGDVFLSGPDMVLITGDIGDARTLTEYLHTIESTLKLPIYFVLGNHDYYYGSIEQIRRSMVLFSNTSNFAKWLPISGVISLTPTTALVGHDGWGDGRLGDYWKSPVMLNDFALIQELARIGRTELLARLNQLGDEAAAHFRRVLPQAFETHQRVILLTHVPPFQEACWHEGEPGGDKNFLPYFACEAVGKALIEIMDSCPDRELLVLCGHTHGSGEAQILPNLRVLTGGAEYGSPMPQPVVEIP